MKFLENAQVILDSHEFSEGVKDFTKNVIRAATGDIVAASEALKFIIKGPMYIRECLFWEKYAMFLNGVFLEDDDIRKISEIFAEKEEQEDYSRRIIKVIDDIDVKIKITYIINLTRALLAGFIVRQDYYRLINAVKNTLEEDLKFLSNTIGKEHLKANIHFEFLKQNGLAIQSIISDDGSLDGDEYIFTPLARMLDQFALNYSNEKYSYSILIKSLSEQSMPVTKAGKVVARFG